MLADEGNGCCNQKVKFQIFLDAETKKTCETGRVPWWDPQGSSPYRCDGLDPRTFRDGKVPMKYWSTNKEIALYWFARAHRAGRINGPPEFLLEGSMDAHAFLDSIFAGDIVVDASTKTIGFTKPVSQVNYPTSEWDVGFFTEEEAQRHLKAALSELSRAAKRTAE